MDPVTHTLTGVMLARAGAGPRTPYATATLVVAATIPDLDYLYILGGVTTYLERHLAWTHCLIGAVILGAGVAVAFWIWGRHRPQAPALLPLLGASCVGVGSHLLLDWSTPYGTQLLWPFKNTRYALDWFLFVDLWVLAILLLCLAVPALFRLISEEIGARRSLAGARRGAWVALAAWVLLAGGRATLHSEGIRHLESRLYHDRSPVRVAAYPTPLSPFRWHGVVETDTTFESVELSLGGSGPAFESFSTHYKPSGSPALEAALATRTGRVYLSWARFPRAEVLPAVAGGWQIRLQDLRYASGAGPARGCVARIELDNELRVVEESLHFRGEGD